VPREGVYTRERSWSRTASGKLPDLAGLEYSQMGPRTTAGAGHTFWKGDPSCIIFLGIVCEFGISVRRLHMSRTNTMRGAKQEGRVKEATQTIAASGVLGSFAGLSTCGLIPATSCCASQGSSASQRIWGVPILLPGHFAEFYHGSFRVLSSSVPESSRRARTAHPCRRTPPRNLNVKAPARTARISTGCADSVLLAAKPSRKDAFVQVVCCH